MSERTKIWIADAMKKLMRKKSIEKIRVTEICSTAEIERPTFYYHFQDKYDLVAWIFYHDAYKTDVISLKSATAGMEKMRQNYFFYKRAYEDTSQTPLWEYMLEYFVRRYTDQAKEILGTETLDTQTRFSIRLYCFGCVGMTKEWLLKDNITPAQTAVSMMFQSMPEQLRNIFFRTSSGHPE